MTDSEIIKALEICLNETDICNGCPYEFDDCLNEDGTSRLMQAALDLIKRQKEENEDLERIVGLMNKRKYYRKFVGEVFRKQKGKELTDPDFDYIYQLYFEQQAEINKLNTAFDVCKKEYDDMFEIARKQKAEIEKFENIKATINKFWDMLLKCKIAKRKDAPTLEEFAEVIGEIEADAIKEFAERLKENVDLCSKYLQEDFPEIVDNLVKEMKGEITNENQISS